MDIQSRKWMLEINNPEEKGWTRDKLKETIAKLKSVEYWCMSDEIGLEEKTPHIHIFLYGSAIRTSTIEKHFPKVHHDVGKGTAQQIKDYIFKEGKWLLDKKADTNIRDSHDEYGTCPVERQGQRNDISDLYDMIKGGMSNYEIIESNPQYMLNVDKIERVRQILKEEKYKNEFRKLEVTYVYGTTGTGKTRYVMEKFGKYQEVYKVNDYSHPFDSYKGQDVLFFDEFYSSFIKISDMLVYLDGYPFDMPCRYANKVPCYTKVYIASNIELKRQYENIQREYPETWKALLRRINNVVEYKEFEVINRTMKEYEQLKIFNEKGTIFENWEIYVDNKAEIMYSKNKNRKVRCGHYVQGNSAVCKQV